MRLRNNSKKSWLGYNCGDGVIIDILPESEFEVDQRVGMFLLEILGADAWLTEVSGDIPKEEPKELELPVVEDVPKEEKPAFCEFCTSKGKYHKKDCTREVPVEDVTCEHCKAREGRHKLLCKRPR